MTDKKFSEFVAKPTPLSTDEVVGYSGGDNIRIPVSSLTGAAGTITSVDGTLPISVDNTTDPAVPVVSISNATTSADGAMSSTDKIRLDSLPSSPVTGVTGVSPIEVDSTTVAIPAISIDAATTSLPGSMSAADKTKLDELVEGGAVNLDAIFEDLKGRAADYPILIECTGQSNLAGVTLYTDNLVTGTVNNPNVREIRQPYLNAVSNPDDTVTLELTEATVNFEYLKADLSPPTMTNGWIGMQGTTPDVSGVGGQNNNIGWTCCDLIQKATGHPVVMVQTWKSGQQIQGANGWLPDGDAGAEGHMNKLRTHALNAAFDALAGETPSITDIKVSASIWVQGESNAATDPQDYYDWWEEVQEDNKTKTMNGSRIGWQTKDLTRTYIGFTNTANGAGMKLIQKPIMDNNGSYVQYINSIGTSEADTVHFDNASLNYLGKLAGLALLAPVPPKRMLNPLVIPSDTYTEWMTTTYMTSPVSYGLQLNQNGTVESNGWRTRIFKATTTDGVAKSIVFSTMPESSAYDIEYTFTAFRTASPRGAFSGNGNALFARQGASAIVGGTPVLQESQSWSTGGSGGAQSPLPSIIVFGLSSSFAISVTGVTGENWDWEVVYKDRDTISFDVP
tara:strand:+ start:804 stop:2666 length:1863 start_codon:yes stop_codon:yes gene_type:complete